MKKKKASEKQTERVQVRFTKPEMRLIKKQVKKNRLGTYLREIILYYYALDF